MMAEATETVTPASGEPAFMRATELLCKWLAYVGGVVLVALVVMTVLSITGRALIPFGLAPIPGDFELVEAGTAFATFCFMPWCQLRGGHITVDLLSERFGPRRDRMLSLAGSLMMAAAALVIAWRLWFGMADKLKYNETTFILGLPMWWFFAISVPPAAVFVLASLASAWRHWRLLRARRARA